MGKDETAYEDSFDVALGGGPNHLGGWTALEMPVRESFDAIVETLTAVGEAGAGPAAVTQESSGYWFGRPGGDDRDT